MISFDLVFTRRHFRLSIFLLLLVLNVYGQNDFRKGYFIDLNNNKTEVFLQYKDYSKLNYIKSASEAIKYKLSVDGPSEDIHQSRIKEFCIPNEFKYKRYFVSFLNGSDNSLSNSNSSKDVFLQVLLEGDASLYSYRNDNDMFYFYKIGNQEVPVILKYDNVTLSNVVVEDRGYKKELYNALKTDKSQPSDFYKIKYNEEDLKKVFNDYNIQKGDNSTIYDNKLSKTNLLLTAFVNFNNTSMILDNGYSESDKTSIFSFGLGAEVELLFKQNWSLFFRASYQKKDYGVIKTREVDFSSAKFQSKFDIKSESLDLVIAPRYYLILNQKNAVFFNAGFGFSLQKGSYQETFRTRYITTVSETSPISEELISSPYLNFGIGYLFAKRYSIEFQMDTNKEIFEGNQQSFYRSFSNKSSQLTISLRYTFN